MEWLGPGEHANIGILIDVGELYLGSAGVDFTLAASIIANGLESKDTKRLKAALDNERYGIAFPPLEAFDGSLRREFRLSTCKMRFLCYST